MGNNIVLSVAAVTEIFGEGQKCTVAAIEYDADIDESALSADSFSVTGRCIETVYVNDGPCKRKDSFGAGRYVILELASPGDVGTTRETVGQGPGSRSIFHPASVEVWQQGALRMKDGSIAPPWEGPRVSCRRVDRMADRFELKRFELAEEKRTLDYQIYVPKDLEAGRQYPLVLFMHDAGACADEPIAPLAQGLGAVIWTEDAVQSKEGCFVVAPHYPGKCANDAFEVTVETEDTVALVKALSEEYPIDRTRIYGTGQSMGCMMLCEMNIRYPQLFAGCLLVAGQWNPETMAACRDKHFWIIVSQGDRKAYPIMGACMARMEEAGGRVIRGGLDAKAPETALRAEIEKLEAQGGNMHFTWFEGESVISTDAQSNPGTHHVLTWARAYEISALREWLLRQRL